MEHRGLVSRWRIIAKSINGVGVLRPPYPSLRTDLILMQPKLALIAMLAPLPAAAFGDMDCISIDACYSEICVAQNDVFSITFDWQDATATVVIADETLTLPASDAPDDTGTTLAYGAQSGAEPGLTVIAQSATRIVAYLTKSAGYETEGEDTMMSYSAVCDLKEAA